jgi:hypothetical protein
MKECSAKDKRIKEAIDAILLTVMEPSRVLSDETVELVKKTKGSSDIWSLTSPFLIILAVLGTGLTAFFLLSKG